MAAIGDSFLSLKTKKSHEPVHPYAPIYLSISVHLIGRILFCTCPQVLQVILGIASVIVVCCMLATYNWCFKRIFVDTYLRLHLFLLLPQETVVTLLYVIAAHCHIWLHPRTQALGWGNNDPCQHLRMATHSIHCWA